MRACDFSPQDLVLEIGSGTGIMTGQIARRARKVFAVEFDKRLMKTLKETLRDFKNIEIIHTDILKLDFSTIHKQGSQKIKVFGNIPYNISTPIIEYLLAHRDDISEIFLTVQKEFAQRLTAQGRSRNFGALSCFVGYYAAVKSMFTIKRNSFAPAPSVESCLVRLTVKEVTPLDAASQERLFKITRTAFGQRRKMLKNNLKPLFPEPALQRFFASRHIDPRARAEHLCLEDFLALAELEKK